MTMPIHEFRILGETVLGEGWVGALATASGVNRRSIARMLKGERVIPDDIAEPLRAAAEILAPVQDVLFADDANDIASARMHEILAHALRRLSR